MHNRWSDFMVGEVVQIVDGPFAAFEGTIDGMDSLTGEIGLLIQVFGSPTPLVVTRQQILRSDSEE
jgi:transcriptional antiterminator NusG